MSEKVTLGSLVGTELEEEFLDFDLTEIQSILRNLQDTDAIDLAHVELLQQQCLRGADILAEYLGRIVKITSYLESKVASVRNKASLHYKDPDGGKVTAEMRKWAADNSPEADEVANLLAKAKGSKVLLEKKYDIIIKSHHHYKELAMGLRKSIVGYNPEKQKVPEGWE